METAAAFEMLKPQCNGHSSVFPAFLWSYGCGSCGAHSTEVNWKLKSTQSIKNKVQAQPCRRFKHQKHETILKIPINGDSPTPCFFLSKSTNNYFTYF